MSGRTASPLIATFQGLLTVVTLPYRRTFWLYTWTPLRDIRAANGDGKLLIPLVKAWKADKYDELQSVQVAVRSYSLWMFIYMSLIWPRLLSVEGPSSHVFPGLDLTTLYGSPRLYGSDRSYALYLPSSRVSRQSLYSTIFLRVKS
jgi:hypothetical protein